MVHITTVGSGSSGNCYIVECTNEAGSTDRLILESGMRFKDVQKALKFDLNGISGCLISHEHGDHAAFVAQMAQKAIIIYATRGTIDALKTGAGAALVPMEKKKVYNIGTFRVMAFETEHDAAEPCGFMIDCADGNRIVFATDTYYLKYRYPDVTVFMLECNYDEGILQRNIRDGIVHPSVGERVKKSHMSVTQCIDTLIANDLSRVKAIMLIHLSSQNSLADEFVQRVERATGKMVYVAKKGESVTIF